MIMNVITDKKIIDKIEKALTKIRPFLNEDGGDIEFVELSDEGVIKVKFTGACSSCTLSDMTLRNGVETVLKKALPQIQKVVEL